MELFIQFASHAEKVLNSPLIHIGKTAVNLWTIAYLAVLSIVLISVTRRCKTWIAEHLLRHTQLDSGTRESVASMTGYIIIGLGFVVILQSAGIDLSALTVIAGAVGLGLSFGLQNIVSNFISGILILVERPIKVGDRIEVAGLIGDVIKISLRATVIRTNENIDIIVPNSEFITSPVTNLTYASRHVRVKIPVGVSYDSHPEEVQRIMLECARRNPGVLSVPAPLVVLERFADSSLDFVLFVSTEEYLRKTMSLRSELNVAILKRFHQAGIEIPFPQRDLHIKESSVAGTRLTGAS